MLSNFVEIKPLRPGRVVPDYPLACQQIKVGFRRTIRQHEASLKTVYSMILYIGIELCQPLQLKAGDRIKIFIEKNNPRIWQIKKALDDRGYKLCNPDRNKLTSRYLKCQITWRSFEPTPSEMPLHIVSHEAFEEGLLIRLR